MGVELIVTIKVSADIDASASVAGEPVGKHLAPFLRTLRDAGMWSSTSDYVSVTEVTEVLMDLFPGGIKVPDEASNTHPCSYGCGLAAEPGDTMCAGDREGHERNRPVHWTEEFPQDY